jgi:hypothetical protein
MCTLCYACRLHNARYGWRQSALASRGGACGQWQLLLCSGLYRPATLRNLQESQAAPFAPNPALPRAPAEDQAQDRIHRLGQTRPVSVFRYIVQDSIEERMLELQVCGAPPPPAPVPRCLSCYTNLDVPGSAAASRRCLGSASAGGTGATARRGVSGLLVTLRGLRAQEHKRQLLSAAFARRSVEELREMRIAHVRMLLRV